MENQSGYFRNWMIAMNFSIRKEGYLPLLTDFREEAVLWPMRQPLLREFLDEGILKK
jgi:hypothetical protein